MMAVWNLPEYTRALVILPSPTSLFPTTPSSLHQSSNVPSFINLVHVLARMNLWYFPSCLCEATSKWWFTKTPPLLFEIFFAPLLLFSHLYPWQSQSCSYQALAHRIRCLVWLVLTIVSATLALALALGNWRGLRFLLLSHSVTADIANSGNVKKVEHSSDSVYPRQILCTLVSFTFSGRDVKNN